MKTLSKKLLTGCMALAMSFAMAIPTFAAEVQPRANLYTSYKVQSATQMIYMYADASVNAPAYLSSTQITWMPGRYGSTTKFYQSRTVGNSQLVISYNQGRVIMTNEYADDGITAVSLPVSGGYHRIFFPNRNAYLNAINNAQIQTSWYSDSNAQLWIFS